MTMQPNQMAVRQRTNPWYVLLLLGLLGMQVALYVRITDVQGTRHHPAQLMTGEGDSGRYVLFHGQYEAYDETSRGILPSKRLFLLDTRYGECSMLVETLRKDGSLRRFWADVEQDTRKESPAIEFRKSNVNGHYPNGDGSLDARMRERNLSWERQTRRLLA